MTVRRQHNLTSTSPQKKPNRVGILFSLVATVAFAAAAVQWFALWHPRESAKSNTLANERQAYLNISAIAHSQAEYFKTDWDGDGKKTYAKYYTHLWTSVDTSGRPIRVDFIPKKLAFATQPSREIHGYYYLDLHDRVLTQNGQFSPLDYEKEWAVLAIPMTDGRNEMLHFLADNSGVYYKFARYVPEQYFDNPLENGWRRIESAEQISSLRP